MSTPILKSYVDERGNISVQVSRDVQMLTREEADCIEAEYRRMQAENDKLRELTEKAWKAAEMLCQAWDGPCRADGVSINPPCPLDERDELCVYGLIQRDLRELGVEVDG